MGLGQRIRGRHVTSYLTENLFVPKREIYLISFGKNRPRITKFDGIVSNVPNLKKLVSIFLQLQSQTQSYRLNLDRSALQESIPATVNVLSTIVSTVDLPLETVPLNKDAPKW